MTDNLEGSTTAKIDGFLHKEYEKTQKNIRFSVEIGRILADLKLSSILGWVEDCLRKRNHGQLVPSSSKYPKLVQ